MIISYRYYTTQYRIYLNTEAQREIINNNFC